MLSAMQRRQTVLPPVLQQQVPGAFPKLSTPLFGALASVLSVGFCRCNGWVFSPRGRAATFGATQNANNWFRPSGVFVSPGQIA